MSEPKLDTALRDMLDQFTVPPLSAEFTDRVVAAATGSDRPLPAAVPSRRDRRGRWVRGHRVIIGVMAFGLMSAAAAATAIFGDVARTIPVIGPIIASVSPARPMQPVRKVAIVKPQPVEAPVPGFGETPPVVEALPPTLPERREFRREIRREIIAERIATELARRDERREVLGLPPKPPRPAQIIPVLRRIPPVDRAAVIERVREIRREQQHAADAALPVLVPALVIARPELNTAIAPVPAPDMPTPPLADAPATAAGEAPRGETLRTPERIEQLRRLRVLRELQQRRREMRRQRQQQ